MKDLAYYNGTITPIDEMMIPANDRGFYFGDGIYEAAMVYHHQIYALGDHLDRMFNSAALVRIPLPYTKEEVGALLAGLVEKVDSDCQFLYWQVTRGTAPRSHLFPQGAESNLYVCAKPFPGVSMADGYKLKTVEDTRFLHCNIKTLNLLPNVMAAQAAAEAGCDEALFIRGDFVTEGAHSNCSILKDGVFITHPLDNLILPGTERKHLIAFCGALGIPVEERPFTPQELLEADEVLMSSTSHPIMRVAWVDGQAVGGRAPQLVEALRASYLAAIP